MQVMDQAISRDEYDKIRRLYEASMEGCVDTLDSLMQKDPRILSKMSLALFGETPLHISASIGHHNFTQKLLSINPDGPKLAMELDRLKRSPLHLASAEGHTDIVRALIEKNSGLCLAADHNGKIPLHYAAMRGRVEIIKLLIGSQRRSVWKKLNEGGETVLHLCVQHNQLEALKVLVESVGCENNEFLNSKDQNGNTILHLAVMLKQVKTVKYLLSIKGVIEGASTLNQSDCTAIQIVKHLPKDSKSRKIKKAFRDAAGLRRSEKATSSWGSKFQRLMKYNDNWIRDKTGALMVVATVIATMTYQTAISPPGGVWQESSNNTTDCTPERNCTAGTAVLVSFRKERYLTFLKFDSAAFVSSLAIVLLLISGLPVRYRPCMWILNVFICSALTLLTFTFLMGIQLVSPPSIDGEAQLIFVDLIFVWLLIMGFCLLYHAIRFLVWLVRGLLYIIYYNICFLVGLVKGFLFMLTRFFHCILRMISKFTFGNHSNNNDSARV